MQKSFNKRLYPNPGALLRDLKFILQRRKLIKILMHGQILDAAFRERLMLAVTQVNMCRYCSFYHTKLALSSGIAHHEISQIAAQSFEDCPPEQQSALLYAQHWAESDASPEQQARRKLFEQYGQQTGDLIELCLHMIRVGNLTGNLLDYLLFKLSFGRIP